MSIALISKLKARALALGAMVLGSAVVLASPGIGAASVTTDGQAVARAARNVSVRETSSMNAVGYQGGRTIYERGIMSGTLHGSIETHLVAVTNSTGEATLTAYTKGGWLKAKATTHAHAETAEDEVGHFYGKLVITGGYGVWAHASGSLAIYGTINRRTLHATGEMDGTFHA